MIWSHGKRCATLLVFIFMGMTCLMPLRRGHAEPMGEAARPGALTQQQWRPWRDQFVTLDGRVVDDANKNISHSEGQGYGLLLSVLAQDRETFTRIWTFTRNEMLLRDDGLSVWRWEPGARPHVTDTNNASDGDLLIAYALFLGGDTWKVQEWTATARAMANTIGRKLVRQEGQRTILLPAVHGFGANDRPDGPVINLSYWIFEALPVMARLAPDTDWQALSDTGRNLLTSARFGPAMLPADWVSIRGARPVPASGFSEQFGYDAVRIPLYLLRAGITDRAILAPFARLWSEPENVSGVIDLNNGKVIEPMADPGYRMIGAALHCALDKKPIPPALRSAPLTNYYPSTLHLLALAALAQHFPGCL